MGILRWPCCRATQPDLLDTDISKSKFLTGAYFLPESAQKGDEGWKCESSF